MGVIFGMFVDAAQVALGLTTFSWLAWAYVTVLLLVVGPTFVQVAPKVVDPPARLIATDPMRVAVWMPLSIGLFAGATIVLMITIFGAVLAPIGAAMLGMAGYLAISRLLGERLLAPLARGAVAPWLASLAGIAVLRVVRLVPYVGAPAQSLVLWVGMAATTCIAVRMGRQWWRRRLPDEVQFRGETLVEWYPDGDPTDGRPSVGSGRPVLDNVRGNERASRDDD